MSKLLKTLKLGDEQPGKDKKKKIENLVVLIIVLIITLIAINMIWKEDTKKEENEIDETVNSKVLADASIIENNSKSNLEMNLEKILSTIKGVGKVNVFINYSESSSTEAMYDETTTTSTTEEGDSSGGTRDVTETESRKEVVFSEENGDKVPVTQKTKMPLIEGAIVTAEGAKDAVVKTNIISAVEAVTGLGIDKVQVFEMN